MFRDLLSAVHLVWFCSWGYSSLVRLPTTFSYTPRWRVECWGLPPWARPACYRRCRTCERFVWQRCVAGDLVLPLFMVDNSAFSPHRL